MKRVFVVAVLLIAIATIAFSQAASLKKSSSTKAEQAVKRIETRYAEAVKRQDTLALGTILADDLVAISSRGEVRNKAQEIDDIKASPDFSVEAFDLDDLNTRVFNGTAVVNRPFYVESNIQRTTQYHPVSIYSSLLEKQIGLAGNRSTTNPYSAVRRAFCSTMKKGGSRSD